MKDSELRTRAKEFALKKYLRVTKLTPGKALALADYCFMRIARMAKNY